MMSRPVWIAGYSKRPQQLVYVYLKDGEVVFAIEEERLYVGKSMTAVRLQVWLRFLDYTDKIRLP